MDFFFFLILWCAGISPLDSTSRKTLLSVICSLILYSPGLTDLGGEGLEGFKDHFRAHSLPRSARLLPSRWWVRLLPVPWTCGAYDRTKSKWGCGESSGVAPGCCWAMEGTHGGPQVRRLGAGLSSPNGSAPDCTGSHKPLPESHSSQKCTFGRGWAAKLLLLVGGYKLGSSDLAILLTSFCLECFKYSDLKLK